MSLWHVEPVVALRDGGCCVLSPAVFSGRCCLSAACPFTLCTPRQTDRSLVKEWSPTGEIGAVSSPVAMESVNTALCLLPCDAQPLISLQYSSVHGTASLHKCIVQSCLLAQSVINICVGYVKKTGCYISLHNLSSDKKKKKKKLKQNHWAHHKACLFR